MKRNRETINILLESTILMGFSNHPSQKKKHHVWVEKKTGPFLGFLSKRGGTRYGNAWKCMKTWETSKFPAEVRKRSEATWYHQAAEKRGGSTARFGFLEVCRGDVFFCCVHLWEKNAWPVWDVHILISHVYIYTWFIIYNDYIHVQIESEKDSHCHGSLMLDQFLEMR